MTTQPVDPAQVDALVSDVKTKAQAATAARAQCEAMKTAVSEADDALQLARNALASYLNECAGLEPFAKGSL